ncbi:MAG: saccharopine dehydrogenase family protein, partial [Acidobacteriota bacterium]|nr:saccharopine dehydrogenase family protein [Acidobacteriota bacterium]
AALDAGVSYFDLTEDVETTRIIRETAEQAADRQIFMPQCGLAPGFIGILAASMVGKFDKLDALKMRVGALPEYPHNHLMYHLTWSTDGVINEYCKPCEVIHRGKRQEVLALDGLERFAIDGVEYEAFNTSGGLGTLCETLEGKVTELNYKTVRYPGHHYLMDFLINGLRMGDTLETQRQLGRIFDRAIPMTQQDVVLVLCAASGWTRGLYSEETNARKIYHQDVHGEHWSAIQITTAAAACVVVDLHREEKLAVRRGFVQQESVPLDTFLANRFGQYYAFDHSHVRSVTS